MPYGKPTVSIDLAEYTDLLNASKQLIESDISLYKEGVVLIITECAKRGFHISSIKDVLEKNKILVLFSGDQQGIPEVELRRTK